MKSLLLIEDNVHLMAINREFLEDSGYRVYEAYDLAEARLRLSENVPDLIVLDVMLPDGNGVEFCRQLRLTMDIPVLFLTAKASDLDIIEGLKSGGDDYVAKPYDLSVLLAHIEAILRRSKGGQASELRVGVLSFDIGLSQAFVDGTLLNLSAKEYGVLLYLAKKKGELVVKDELYKAVWGQDMIADSAALWTAVSRLNKKISRYARSFFIESTHKGYTLHIV
ncbi:MAG: response regulator transcription factor [Clostridiales bacterium]|nr:response regulator transcription factor [Clostridiales bacterium]